MVLATPDPTISEYRVMLWVDRFHEADDVVFPFGVSKVAATLRLDYAGLKRWLTVLTPPVPVPSAASSAFVEMMLGLPPSGPGCVLTLSAARGRSLRIELTGVASSEVTAVARSLWEAVPCSP